MEGSRVSNSEEETLRIGEEIARACKGGETILLHGSLGMGKTILTKGIAKGLGIDGSEVTSPSFTLVKEHRGRLVLYHVDLYRIDNPREIADLGLEDLLGRPDGVTVVEWGEKMETLFSPFAAALRVWIEDLGGNSRRIRISGALNV